MISNKKTLEEIRQVVLANLSTKLNYKLTPDVAKTLVNSIINDLISHR